jgi:hypothetical protein
MITNSLSIHLVDSPDDAPKYGEEFTMIKIDKCIIVNNGTVEGNSTVDLQLSDIKGNKYLIFATGKIIESLGMAVCGAMLRESELIKNN